MNTTYPRIIIAGIRGGAGKTTVSLGIIGAWKRKGRSIVPYKKGPDYIDAGWLSAAAGQPCYNLDAFLISRENLLSSFAGHFGMSDCGVIEGNRGLYDGMDAKGTYSTAELAKLLAAPVILVMDCTKVTRTAAALLLGIVKFDPRVDIRGVVLNQVAGKRHEQVIRDSIERHCRVPVMGAIPRLRSDLLSERHMGLTSFQEHPGVEKAVASCADTAEKHLDLDLMWKIAESAKPIPAKGRGTGPERKTEDSSRSLPRTQPPLRIGIIRDSAFQFYYPENFEEIERRGARLVEVSALRAKKLPGIDALYIGGGFPETHAIALARNGIFRRAVRKAADEGLPIYAECGGLMYLGESLILEGKTYPMAGVFPLRFTLERKPQAHGYTVVRVSGSNPFYRNGTLLRGHEFHYSRVMPPGKGKDMRFAFRMERGEGIMNNEDGIVYKNVLATYTHLHGLGSPEWADGLISQAMAFRKGAR